MIAIVNIDGNVRKSGPHLYEIRINREPVTRFTHDREKPLSKCLFNALLAVIEKEKQK